MRKRTIDLMQDCLAVLESADIEDTDALIGQLRAEISLYAAKRAVHEAFENAEAPVTKPAKRKPASKKANKPATTKATGFTPAAVPTAA
jgi:hypothetical protein